MNKLLLFLILTLATLLFCNRMAFDKAKWNEGDGVPTLTVMQC